MPLPITDVFADLPDPRRETENKLHPLVDLLALAVCAVIGGAETWDAIAEYGHSKEPFFRRFLGLPHGIPSPDTFSRVFAKLDPAAFADRFGRWMAQACSATGLIPVAIDGKSNRAAKRATATGCLHTVSAFATQARLTLAQAAVEEGSNEIATIPDLLGALDLAGAIVTIDAAGCQRENAQLIRDGGGHYLLCVKGNQPGLLTAVEGAFERADAAGYEGLSFDHHGQADEGHGRVEFRSVAVIHDPKGLPEDWVDIKAVMSVVRQREVGGVKTTSTHYYISSHAGTAEEMAGLIRGHWGIEIPQSECCSSVGLCAAAESCYDRPRSPAGAGRLVRAAPWSRRRLMPTDRPDAAPPRARPSLPPPRRPRSGLSYHRRGDTGSRVCLPS